MKLDVRLQQLRHQLKLSQENLAEAIGVSRQAVAKWENGQALPEIDKLIALSQFFGVSIDKLVKESDDTCQIWEDSIHQKPSLHQMIPFLIRAKQATYAGKGCEVASSRPSSHDLAYAEGEYSYIDTYLGGEKFAGEEAIWLNHTPVWSMNYVGKVIGEGFSGDFLKEVLFQVPIDKPFRGPDLYIKGDFCYHNDVKGNMEWFQGYETIYYRNVLVYQCYYHGGEII